MADDVPYVGPSHLFTEKQVVSTVIRHNAVILSSALDRYEIIHTDCEVYAARGLVTDVCVCMCVFLYAHIYIYVCVCVSVCVNVNFTYGFKSLICAYAFVFQFVQYFSSSSSAIEVIHTDTVSLLSSYAENYYHFITEFLPRFRDLFRFWKGSRIDAIIEQFYRTSIMWWMGWHLTRPCSFRDW